MFREFYEANIDDKETDKLREELRNMLRQRAVGNQIDEWFAIKDPASGQFNFLRRGRDGRWDRTSKVMERAKLFEGFDLEG